ncbi:hypothetical protein [Aeromicrobium massiliense]|uniref:hypothetical protein n=1 Tax=Aeromicrobium massiliense TaxID=1464554 RepID=UPI00031C7027|nr:hypothetical protein [Aeromicrobium massiliense]
MTVLSTVRAAAAGALLVNAVPHGVKGITGQRFPSPFAKPPAVGLSGPVPNVLWSAANLAAGSWLRRGVTTPAERRAMVLGGVGTAAGLAAFFHRLPTLPEA